MNTEDHFEGLENAASENTGLDSEGPFRRSSGIFCSEAVKRNVIQHPSCADNFDYSCSFVFIASLKSTAKDEQIHERHEITHRRAEETS